MDWKAFLDQHNIAYTTKGPNASRGHVNIRCPFCGDDDPSDHMGISLSGRGWSCWRNAAHRGRSDVHLIMQLLRCSAAEARSYAGGSTQLLGDEDMLAAVRERLGGEPGEVPPSVGQLKFPPEFHPLKVPNRFGEQFWDYLRGRGYRKSHIAWLAEAYDLQWAVRGRFAYRVVVPYHDRFRGLLTWTARAIKPDVEPRYKALAAGEQVTSPKATLLGLPVLWSCPNPKVLLVCEGPFDALWITTFGRTLGVYATCLSGLSLSPEQADALNALKRRFPATALLLDSEARLNAFRLANAGVQLSVLNLPPRYKDPAVLPASVVLDLCTELVSGA